MALLSWHFMANSILVFIRLRTWFLVLLFLMMPVVAEPLLLALEEVLSRASFSWATDSSKNLDKNINFKFKIQVLCITSLGL